MYYFNSDIKVIDGMKWHLVWVEAHTLVVLHAITPFLLMLEPIKCMTLSLELRKVADVESLLILVGHIQKLRKIKKQLRSI